MIEDHDARFERAFATHWHDVVRFSMAWTNDLGAAEEISQETFARLWQHRARLDWTKPMLPWLFTTSRHLGTDRIRRIRRRMGGGQPAPAIDESTLVRWLDLQSALGKLSPFERAALLITSVDGMSAVDAAPVLGRSAGAVRAAASRARQKLEEA